jgi:hypothetical protein
MSTVKDKERASSLTGSIIIITISVVQQKDTYPRVAESDTFFKDRKKFKAYEA